MSTPFCLILPRQIYDEMIVQARAELPNECCGLLAGRVVDQSSSHTAEADAFIRTFRAGLNAANDRQRHGWSSRRSRHTAYGLVLRRYALVNEAASPTEYVSEPHSMFAAEKSRRQEGLQFLAVYHSHPTSEPIPSRTDRERNYSPDVMNLIISLMTEEPVLRAWWLTAESYREAEWRLI